MAFSSARNSLQLTPYSMCSVRCALAYQRAGGATFGLYSECGGMLDSDPVSNLAPHADFPSVLHVLSSAFVDYSLQSHYVGLLLTQLIVHCKHHRSLLSSKQHMFPFKHSHRCPINSSCYQKSNYLNLRPLQFNENTDSSPRALHQHLWYVNVGNPHSPTFDFYSEDYIMPRLLRSLLLA